MFDLVKFFPRRFLQRDTAKLRVYEHVRQRRAIFYEKRIDNVRRAWRRSSGSLLLETSLNSVLFSFFAKPMFNSNRCIALDKVYAKIRKWWKIRSAFLRYIREKFALSFVTRGRLWRLKANAVVGKRRHRKAEARIRWTRDKKQISLRVVCLRSFCAADGVTDCKFRRHSSENRLSGSGGRSTCHHVHAWPISVDREINMKSCSLIYDPAGTALDLWLCPGNHWLYFLSAATASTPTKSSVTHGLSFSSKFTPVLLSFCIER